jgi:hypothetical protein
MAAFWPGERPGAAARNIIRRNLPRPECLLVLIKTNWRALAFCLVAISSRERILRRSKSL